MDATNEASSCSYPQRNGNSFTPLVDILPTYRAICSAAESAKRSVWVVVSFFDPKFEMPDKRGQALPYLERLAQRGLDVRILAWCNPDFYSRGYINAEHYLPYFQKNKSHVKVRWDFSPDERHCHHEKSWIVDGLSLLDARDGDTCQAFTGGIVIGGPLTGQDHSDAAALRHDIFSRFTGPCSTDLVHSFVQRWNGARGHKQGPLVCYPNEAVANDLPYPSRVSSFNPGQSRCQILRSICTEHYRNNAPPPPGASSHNLVAGEASIYQAYKAAISSAKNYIYIENQHIAHEGLLQMLHDAMNRGVLVLFLVPGAAGIVSVLRAERDAAEAWQKNQSSPRPWYASLFLKIFPLLAAHPNFVMAGIRSEIANQWIYVHSKLMIVDDEWLTLGSANFVDISFEKDHTEVNVAVWDAKVTRALRHSLLCEHRKIAEFMTAEGDGREAVAAAMQEARSNQVLLAQGKNDAIRGRLVAIDPVTYGANSPSAAPHYKVRY